jgi:hypothetical protein
MGDMGDHFNDIKDARREIRAQLGVECPECKRLLPKANATILLPGQRCARRGHEYRDQRQRMGITPS